MRIPHDKMGHAILGVLVLLVALMAGATYTVAMLIVAVVAVGKEVYDHFHPKTHTADVWDAVATVSLAGLVVLTLYYRSVYG